MSNIYVTEPPYSGKVVLETNKGDIEVELFSKECPLTCKNFIALALEGYYDNLVWHRMVADFIIQTGDPTGSGLGGESFYGQSFSDEFHQRLRFNRRGLLGMANASQPNSNDSQFFLTLAAAPELQGRHTMFGRISNNTIYNLVNLAESAGEVGEDDRPVFPPKLRTVRIVENPFEGEIELRITGEEREEMKRNKREAAKRKVERESAAAGSGDVGKRKKNTSLLSFGEEEDAKDGDTFKGRKSSHDLLKNDKRLRAEAATPLANTPAASASTTVDANGGALPEAKKRKTEEKEESLSDLRRQHKTKSKLSDSADKIAELEASIRGSSRNMKDLETSKAKKVGRGKDLLQEYRSKYKKVSSPSSGRKKDEETASLLSSFQKRLRAEVAVKDELESVQDLHGEDEIPEELREYGASDEDDADWRNHKFDFGGQAIANDGHDDDEYVTLDPRDTASSKAANLGFGGSEAARRAKEEKVRDGRRGRDWVDPRDWKGSQGRRRSDHDEHHRRDRGSGGSQALERKARYEEGPPPPRRDLEKW